jgi:transposase InsO family protein
MSRKPRVRRTPELSIARWIEEYNHDRPHRGLHGRTPHGARARFAQSLTSNTAPCVQF